MGKNKKNWKRTQSTMVGITFICIIFLAFRQSTDQINTIISITALVSLLIAIAIQLKTG